MRALTPSPSPPQAELAALREDTAATLASKSRLGLASLGAVEKVRRPGLAPAPTCTYLHGRPPWVAPASLGLPTVPPRLPPCRFA